MVRLKVRTGTNGNQFALFQFLMVRLKVVWEKRLAMHSTISIPYGSIKSHKVIRISFGKHISIPYGSIKRQNATGGSSTSTGISIPYGSIKSFMRNGNL